MNTVIPEFVASAWYRDYSDHRCPHDSWLELVSIGETAEGERRQIRKTSVVIRLLGAYHDGHIVFNYSGVRRYIMSSGSSGSGHNDWMDDTISISSDGFLVHDICWSSGESSWRIEAEAISYEWIPSNC